MQQIANALTSAESKQMAEKLAPQVGMSAEQTQRVISSVTTELSETLERLTLSRGGLADLVGALADGHHERYVEEPETLEQPSTIEDGSKILGHILGSKDASRAVAARTARKTGASENDIKKLLPLIAAMFMGGLSRQTKPALNKVASVTSDPFEGHKPLPMPPDTIARSPAGRTSNPLDDLSDIIRRGGRTPGGAGSTSGGLAWNIVRSIIGAALGFQSRGIMGWIIRVVVMRWGWALLKRILTRVFLGR